MHYQTGGFVHDNEIVIFKENIQRNFFRQRCQRTRWWDLNTNFITRANFVTGLDRAAIDDNMAPLDQFLQKSPGMLGKFLAHELVKASSCHFVCNNVCRHISNQRLTPAVVSQFWVSGP